jgi:hypothetical protein
MKDNVSKLFQFAEHQNIVVLSVEHDTNSNFYATILRRK